MSHFKALKGYMGNCCSYNSIFNKVNELSSVLTRVEPLLCVTIVFARSGVIVKGDNRRVVHAIPHHIGLIHREGARKTSIPRRSGNHSYCS